MQEEPQDPRIRRLCEAESLLGRVDPQDWGAAEDEIRRIVREYVQGTVTKHCSSTRRIELRDIIQPARIGMPQVYIEGEGWFPERTPPDEGWERQRVQWMRDRLISFVRGVIGDLREEEELEHYRRLRQAPTEAASLQDPHSSWQESPGLPGLKWRPSCTQIVFKGNDYDLNVTRAQIMKEVIARSLDGPVPIPTHEVLLAVGKGKSQIRMLFRGSPIWQKLLVTRKSPKGVIQLDLDWEPPRKRRKRR